MTLFCKLCATEEGFFQAGSLPARFHNPLDLRHSPHSRHPEDSDAIGQIDSDAEGWADAERQARIWADRGDTLGQAIYSEAPPGVDGNNAERYLAFVIDGFGGRVSAETPMTEVLEILA